MRKLAGRRMVAEVINIQAISIHKVNVVRGHHGYRVTAGVKADEQRFNLRRPVAHLIKRFTDILKHHLTHIRAVGVTKSDQQGSTTKILIAHLITPVVN